jgi:hypothetical protein
LQDPNSKKTGGVAQGVGSEFKPQYCKKKKTKKLKAESLLRDFSCTTLTVSGKKSEAQRSDSPPQPQSHQLSGDT